MKGKASSAYRSIAFVIGSERKKKWKVAFFWREVIHLSSKWNKTEWICAHEFTQQTFTLSRARKCLQFIEVFAIKFRIEQTLRAKHRIPWDVSFNLWKIPTEFITPIWLAEWLKRGTNNTDSCLFESRTVDAIHSHFRDQIWWGPLTPMTYVRVSL